MTTSSFVSLLYNFVYLGFSSAASYVYVIYKCNVQQGTMRFLPEMDEWGRGCVFILGFAFIK